VGQARRSARRHCTHALAPPVEGTTAVTEPQFKLRSMPHVVILGAGASVAAFRHGDARGRRLPTMENLVSTLGLEDVLERAGLMSLATDFEAAYGALVEHEASSALVREVEERVQSYFEDLELPDEVTLYDRLLLSLRFKDVVATFNWDPFLADAFERLVPLVGRERLPLILHLHGNVRVGYCPDHRERGDFRNLCRQCDKPFTRTELLYPVKEKNYTATPFLQREWELVRHFLATGFTMTIFGYGAPTSDAGAVDLLLRAWKQKGKREVETVEIIDIKDEETLGRTWRDFTFSHHWKVRKRLEESFIGISPRRSAERVFVPTIEGGYPPPARPLPVTRSLDALVASAQPLFEEELEELNAIRAAYKKYGAQSPA
jgi:hypothetical protein